jgi:hypothetical protein
MKASVGPRLTLGDAASTRSLPRPSRRALLVIGLVVVVLVASGVGYAVLKPPGPSGATTVRGYFDDLARGDTQAALERVASDVYRSGPNAYPMLIARALADPANRPTDLEVLGSEPIASEGVALESVRISYKVGGQTVSQTMIAGQVTSRGEDYYLERPFLSLSVSSAGGRRIMVNGIVVDSNTVTGTVVFPGRYTAVAEGNALVTGETKAATIESGRTGGPAVLVAMASPALAPGALETIRGEVKRFIDGCAESTSVRSSGCPFSLYTYYGSDESVTWKVVSYPSVAVNASQYREGRVPVRSETYGEVQYTVTYTDFTGAPRADSGELRYRVEGTATAAGSTINVSLD